MSNSLASVHPELIPEWSERNLPLTPDKITFGSNKRVWWKGACGHEWETSVKARSKGEKCPICSGARVIEGINDLATLKPLLAQEWSEKNELKPTEVSVASHKKIIWKCKHGHEWEASVKSRTVNGTGCPYCSHNKVLAGFNDLASQYPDIATEWSDRNLPLLPTMVTAFANSWESTASGLKYSISATPRTVINRDTQTRTADQTSFMRRTVDQNKETMALIQLSTEDFDLDESIAAELFNLSTPQPKNVSEKKMKEVREKYEAGTLQSPISLPEKLAIEEEDDGTELAYSTTGEYTKVTSNLTFDDIDCLERY